MMMSSGLFSFSDSQVSGLLQVSRSGQKKVGVGLMPVSRNSVHCWVCQAAAAAEEEKEAEATTVRSSLFCKGSWKEKKFNVESSLQIELSFEGSHVAFWPCCAKSSSAAATNESAAVPRAPFYSSTSEAALYFLRTTFSSSLYFSASLKSFVVVSATKKTKTRLRAISKQILRNYLTGGWDNVGKIRNSCQFGN